MESSACSNIGFAFRLEEEFDLERSLLHVVNADLGARENEAVLPLLREHAQLLGERAVSIIRHIPGRFTLQPGSTGVAMPGTPFFCTSPTVGALRRVPRHSVVFRVCSVGPVHRATCSPGRIEIVRHVCRNANVQLVSSHSGNREAAGRV